MGRGSQLGLLLWKNWILQKRRMCVTIFEVAMPVFFAVLILLIRFAVESTEYSEPTYYSRDSVTSMARFEDTTIVGYSPENTDTTQVMGYVLNMLDTRTTQTGVNFSIMGFATEDDALDFITNNEDTMRHLIVFEDSDTSLPQQLSYKVRPYSGSSDWYTDETYPVFQTGGPRDGSDPDYRSSGVIYLQALMGEAVAKFWISTNGGDPNSIYFGVYDQRMAYPPYYDDPMITVIQQFFPFFVILSFIVSVIINTKNLVYEKERKLKESMKLMGLTSTALWLSWFITFSIYMVPVMAIYALFLGADIAPSGPVLGNSDASLFFVFLLCYGVAMITFCFMVSTFAQKANVGGVMAGILFFAFYFPYLFIQTDYSNLGRSTKLVAALLLNTAMSLGANAIGIYEGTGAGAKWSNFTEPGAVDDNLSLLDCMVMLLVDALIHIIIAWYLDNIWPGEYGVPKPYCFCFKKSYWLGSEATERNYGTDDLDNKHFEKDPTGLKAGIQIFQLRKVFDKKKVAVDGTSLNMYEGQITALLGHNGAGKTTTMSMLTGFIPPTSGTARVNGCDITEDIQGVRRSLGLCPQHNILFDTLTVKEHLTFFAKLKGCTGPEVRAEVLSTAKEVGLETKIGYRSEGLSGGQKRKLSVGIALIGGSKVVILDEPTSGMDPAARRQTWNVLQRAREGRTIVLSTHYMDEADLLGDRIAIMAEGVVKCCGTSMFLKKLYGAGYHLVVVKRPDCDIETLTRVVNSHVATAELETVINAEVSYLLPDNESARFAALFTELEDHRDQLGLTSFGTSATTMEEVFLKVGENAFSDEDSISSEGRDENGTGHINHTFEPAPLANGSRNQYEDIDLPKVEGQTGDQSNNSTRTDNESINLDVLCKPSKVRPKPQSNAFNKGFTKLTGLSLIWSMIKALFVKKMLHTWRNRVVTLVQLLLPVIFTVIGMAAVESSPDTVEAEPALVLNLDPYGTTDIPYTMGLNTDADKDKFGSYYVGQFDSQNLEEFDITTTGQYQSYDNYTLEKAEELGISTFDTEVIIGMEVIDTVNSETFSAVSHYNGAPYHAEPIAMNYLMNTFLQYALDSTAYGLQSTMDPLPKDPRASGEDNATTSSTLGFNIGFFISFGMAFLTTLFIYILIKERQVGAKHMQVVSGVGPITYWLPTFLWDFVNYIVPSLLLLVVFAAYSTNAYLNDGRWALVIFVLVIYGFAALPCMYLVQFAFKSPPMGVVIVVILNILTGLVTLLAVYILTIPTLGTESIGETLDWIFMVVFPNYNMASCFSNIYTNYLNLDSCADVDCNTQASACCPGTCDRIGYCTDFEEDFMAWEKPGIGAYLVFMFVQGVVCTIAVLLIEYNVFQKLWYILNERNEVVDDVEHGAGMGEDSDVEAEKQRILSMSPSKMSAKGGTDPLLLVNLYKRYGTFIAVDHLYAGVPEQECFGLLGQNGAGKTTTFKMLTGDVMVTSGNAYLKGHDVRGNIKQVQANMGYCPQFDALIDQMTGRETLVMYARLRGVPEENIAAVVSNLIDVLMLRPHADRLAGTYSGGNKRKLSTAIALVGDPPFIMLDEPSSGMDPKARRQLWNVLSQVRESGHTLVLTSHSMEECDALCTRIAIMVNGKFMCLGSPQHLKNKFGQGYTLIVKMGALENAETAPIQPVIETVMQHFPGAKVFDDHQGYVHFQVPDSGVKIAQVFSLMEQTKVTLSVEDYSVHQTTLEQVFLTFTRAQKPPKEDKSKSCMKSCLS